MTEFIIGERRSGKTTELIERSIVTGAPILAPSRCACQYILTAAKELGYENLPKPITITNITKYNNNMRSIKDILEHGILIDELDITLQNLFGGIEVKAVTITERAERNITRLFVTTD